MDWEGAQKNFFPQLNIAQIKNKYYMTLKYKSPAVAQTSPAARNAVQLVSAQRAQGESTSNYDIKDMVRILEGLL